jgi:hypothetical protein
VPLSFEIAEFCHFYPFTNLSPIIYLPNANDLKMQNAIWSADSYLIANSMAQQSLAHG